jgi:hypothetical protein
MIDPTVLAGWKHSLAQMRADLAFVARHHERDARRRRVRAEIVDLFDRFADGRIQLAQFREIYHRGTAKDWDFFGLKGLSGAMFLNTLVKHLPGYVDEITAKLRESIKLPATENEARVKMRALFDRLIELINLGELSARDVQSTRVPFFVSSAWHIRDAEAWPAYYESMRWPLKTSGLYQEAGSPVETYFRFVAAVRELRDELGISTWELEHLCVWRPPTEATPSPPSAATPVELKPRIWLIAVGRDAEFWEEFRDAELIGIGWDYLGDLQAYESIDAVRAAIRARRGPDDSEPVMDSRACWQFSHEMKPGDIVFVRKGRSRVIGYGTVASDYRFLPQRKKFRHVRDVSWIWTGDARIDRKLQVKTLTEITIYDKQVAMLRKAVDAVADVALPDPTAKAARPDDDDDADAPVYGVEDAVADLFRSKEELIRLRDLVLHRKNLILTGPPGVGKTYVARRLAYLVAGIIDDGAIRMVQFHQSYGYEDFVQGYRPAPGGGFVRRDGPFLEFCQLARQDADGKYILIIDEINRGNLSKILGELMMLLEADKRGPEWQTRLAYSSAEESFFVPPNVYIIGTMNTADRSLAFVDYALRRRFAFFELGPQLADPRFEAWLSANGAPATLIARIRERVGKVNAEINEDPQLGAGYLIGHSYFTALPEGAAPDDEWYERIVTFEIEPLLREYYFDRLDRAKAAVSLLLGDA